MSPTMSWPRCRGSGQTHRLLARPEQRRGLSDRRADAAGPSRHDVDALRTFRSTRRRQCPPQISGRTGDDHAGADPRRGLALQRSAGGRYLTPPSRAATSAPWPAESQDPRRHGKDDCPAASNVTLRGQAATMSRLRSAVRRPALAHRADLSGDRGEFPVLA